MQQNSITVAMFGVGCLTALEITALMVGVDGQFFSLVVGAIGTIIGGVIGYTKAKAKGEPENGTP